MVVNFNGVDEAVDDDFSFSDFTCQEYIGSPDNTTIYMSCFAQQSKVFSTPDENGVRTVISEAPIPCFRSDMTGVRFLNCNMSGCLVPDGNTVINI